MFSFKKNNLEKIKTFIRNSEEVQIDKEDKEELIKMIRPTVGIRTKSCEDKNLKLGTSKIGGKPDLPKDFEWPKADGKPMLFCAQYNLAELTKFDKENRLPKKGFFYVFVSLDQDWKEFNGVNQPYKFIFSETENIIRTEFPNDLDENQTFKTAVIEYFEYYTIPHWQNYKLFEFDKKYDDFNFYFIEPIEFYMIEELYQDSDNMHQILGHDRSIQSSVVYDFASKELGLYSAESSEYQKRWNDILELSKTYELLLQLDCYDSNTDLTKFGGSGTYYFGLSKTDLENMNFSNIKMSFQMT
ncbi:YwqG family protein [Aestuariibaculum sp. M13]|uniref:YwqG family protein n=1 Tax=Aestuariibaculum sp. M13 TaxID=2967132 RepID=UPI002159DC9B|nr:YwqG family protein [Aestuariibaculum sp. M13]MCR8668042.1 YwqG family protein [Aestuariibaculum sp. M13]